VKIKLEVELDTDKERDQALMLELVRILEEYRNEQYDER